MGTIRLQQVKPMSQADKLAYAAGGYREPPRRRGPDKHKARKWCEENLGIEPKTVTAYNCPGCGVRVVLYPCQICRTRAYLSEMKRRQRKGT